tara:strand:- start:318 stop:485 length:168 start_codon:yes stop_codon:yes gene_type:complete
MLNHKTESVKSVQYQEGYVKGYHDAVREVTERLKAKDEMYRKDLEVINYDLPPAS